VAAVVVAELPAVGEMFFNDFAQIGFQGLYLQTLN
jgi:hypothetical protein